MDAQTAAENTGGKMVTPAAHGMTMPLLSVETHRATPNTGCKTQFVTVGRMLMTEDTTEHDNG